MATTTDKYVGQEALEELIVKIKSSSGGSTNVQINGTSITSNNIANILTQGAYNSSTNKIATMSDIPSIDSSISSTSENPVQNKAIYNEFKDRQDTLKEIYDIPISSTATTSIRIYASSSQADTLPRTNGTYGFLKPGIYRIACGSYASYIYYYGTDTTTNRRLSVSANQTILLYVYRYSSDYKWYYMIDSSSAANANLYYGYTTSSGGGYGSKNLNNLLTYISSYVINNLNYSTSSTSYALSAYQGYILNTKKVGFKDTVDTSGAVNPLENMVKQTSATTVSNMVLLSTINAGQGQWTASDTTPTSGSSIPITSGGVYNALIGGWQFQEDRVVSSSVQNVNFTIDLTKYDYRVEMMISAPYNGNFVGSLRNSSGSTYSIPTTWVANTVGNGNTWGTYPAMSANNEILLADTNTNDTSNTHNIVLEMSMFPSVNRLSYHVDSAIMNGNFHEIKEIYGIMDTSTAPVMLRLRASSSTGVTGEFKIYKRSRS